MKLFRAFHEVLRSLLLLHLHCVRQSTAENPVPARIAEDPKYAPYFADCLGALDGTHIDVWVCGEPNAPYRNRKGTLTQNVLAVCSFDLQFSYILAGWEGSAHDSRVLTDALGLEKGRFDIPPGKYYLGDAGYANSDTLLTPYRGVRYHLKEQALSGAR